jgi:uncharacterized protein YjbI with pentapeptide repeats
MGDVAPAQGRASDELGVNQLPPRRRHTFLHGRYTWNDVRCQPPYSEVPFYFGEDLEWVARQRGWRIVTLSPTGGATARIGQRLRSRLRHEPTHGSAPDLRRAAFEDIDLSSFDLSGANLEGATFSPGCRLDGTNLINADLRGARFGTLDLSKAILLDEKQEEALRSQLPPAPDSPHTSPLVPVYTRNELLWIVSRGYSLRLLNLRNANIYQRDLDELDLSPDCLVSASAFALVGSIAKNRADKNPPFFNVEVHSWKDLLWLKLALRAGIISFGMPPVDLSDLRHAMLVDGDFRGADLFKADLHSADLTRAVLDGAELSYARLNQADMSEAWIRGVNLVGAKLVRARLANVHLEGADLLEANLHHARLDDAQLCGARLSVADLRSATFRNASLECVDLRGAQVNAETSFIDATVNKGTQWGDVVFHSTPLLEINWRSAKTLGDESILHADNYIKRSDERNRHYRDVMRAYRQMYDKLYEQGFYGPARTFRLREKRLVRQQLRENHQWYDWFMSWLAFFLIGYGEQPGKLLRPYFAVIALWTVFYYELANRALPFLPPYKADQITWFQSVTLSASTFRGEPSFPPDLLQQPYIGKLLPVLGAAETAIGTIIILAMTLLWTRRLFGNETPVVKTRKRWIRRIARGFRRRQADGVVSPTPATPTQDTS